MTAPGKWGDARVPKLGWDTVCVDDLGDIDAVCEMCESQYIRFVHTLEHPDYPEQLRCGCICAGKMTGDPEGAKAREDRLKLAGGQRNRWLIRKWKESRGGNPYLKTHDGFHVVVYSGRSGKWAFRVSRDGQVWPSERWFDSESKAKLAAFEAMLAHREVKP